MLTIVNMGLPLGDLLGLVIAGPLVQATQYVSVQLGQKATNCPAHLTTSCFISRWRAAFWLIAGLSIVPLIGTIFLVKSRPVLSRRTEKRVDWLGMFLFTAGPTLLFYPLSQARSAPKGWATPCE
jgi:hypothetical protein